MAQRYKVIRRWVKHKGVIYREGDLLPEDFTHHDRFRTVYPSRIGLVEVSDAEITLTDPVIPPEEPKPPLEPLKTELPSEDPKAAEDTPTGETEPPAEEIKTDTSDEAKGSEIPEPPASEEEGSEDKPEEPSSTDEEKKDKDPEATDDKVEEPPVAIQPPKAKPITSVSGKAPTGSKPARPLSNKPTGTSKKA